MFSTSTPVPGSSALSNTVKALVRPALAIKYALSCLTSVLEIFFWRVLTVIKPVQSSATTITIITVKTRACPFSSFNRQNILTTFPEFKFPTVYLGSHDVGRVRAVLFFVPSANLYFDHRSLTLEKRI